MKLDVDIINKLLRDPVMSAKVLLGEDLDYFQKARLRYFWFVPEKVDSSGWGTGKTRVEWIYMMLRLILLPNQIGGVYYPNWDLGKQEFWDANFNRERPEIFYSQFVLQSGRYDKKDAGCWIRTLKNGSRLFLPAPGFLNDSKNQVSRSFTTLIVGEYTQSSTMGEGVDELTGRVRGPCFNKNHPVWSHHYLLSAHAESPSHPSYKYYKASRDAEAGKLTARESHRNIAISFCYLDWSEKFLHLRSDDTIMKSKRTLSRDEYRRRVLGIWSVGGKGWYHGSQLVKILKEGLHPEISRKHGEDIYVLGQDTAPGLNQKADECFFTVWRIREVNEDQDWTLDAEDSFWHISPVAGYMLTNVDGPQISGFMHWLDSVFGLSLIVMDPGGGGAWVYKELKKPRQLIQNEMRNVVGFCTRNEPGSEMMRPIVVFFKRGGDLAKLWEPNFQKSEEGIVEAMHRMVASDMRDGRFQWPQITENLSNEQLAQLSEGEQKALKGLDYAWKQMGDIRVKVNKAGQPFLTKNGFHQFESSKKKDAAYATCYGYCAVQMVIRDLLNEDAGDDEYY